MSIHFTVRSIPELASLPEAKRNEVWQRCHPRAWRHWQTWFAFFASIGFVMAGLFLVILAQTEPYSWGRLLLGILLIAFASGGFFQVKVAITRPYIAQELTRRSLPPRDYSADECVRFREVFRPTAAIYRRRRRIGSIWFLSGGGCLVFGGFLDFVSRQNLMPWVTIPFFVCVGVWFWILATTPRLTCPGCSQEMEYCFGDYCPECGSKGLEPPGQFRPPHCRTCGKSMHGGRGRKYKIRACTHCGLMLDDKGL